MFCILLLLLKISQGGHDKGEGQIRKDQEMCQIEVPDAKFPKNQLKNCIY